MDNQNNRFPESKSGRDQIFLTKISDPALINRKIPDDNKRFKVKSKPRKMCKYVVEGYARIKAAKQPLSVLPLPGILTIPFPAKI